MDLPGKNYMLLQKVHAAAGFHCTLFWASLRIPYIIAKKLKDLN